MLHFTFSAKDAGIDLYQPASVKCGYAYSPSLLYREDGSMDAWFSFMGDSTLGFWDWVCYKHSEKPDAYWPDSKAVLQPTPDSWDHFSCCDPGVIQLGDYYYIGYTSCINSYSQGRTNHIFVARSRKPDGPYEKWNGSGWGGDPAPFILYDGPVKNYGVGEVSFVELNGVLYIYYTWDCDSGAYLMVSTADAADPDWPARVSRGQVCCRKFIDQVDVLYSEEYRQFIGIGVKDRFSDHSAIQIIESEDGIHFSYGEFISEKIAKYCHNAGFSKRGNGHLKSGDPLMIAYGYSAGDTKVWGQWATRIQQVSLSAYPGELRQQDPGDRGIFHYDFWLRDDPQIDRLLAVRTIPASVRLCLEPENAVTLAVVQYDLLVRRYPLQMNAETLSEIAFSEYDPSVVAFDGTRVVPLRAGRTEAMLTYRDRTFRFKITVEAGGTDLTAAPQIRELVPVWKTITMSADPESPWKKQLHCAVRLSDGTFRLAANGLPGMPYTLSFRSLDESVVRVTEEGFLIAVRPGKTAVEMELSGLQCRVEILVREDD